MLRRSVKWLAFGLLSLPLLAILYVAIFGWNWARGPLQRAVTEKTGRELVIGGDLEVRIAWPAPRVRAHAVTFANPSWAREKQMVAADEVEFSVDLAALLDRKLMFPEVRLTRPVVYLEQASEGRKTWLLDLDQKDELARIPIGRLTLDQGRLGYLDAAQKTSILADISTQDRGAGGVDADAVDAGVVDNTGVIFSAKGTYKGLALAGRGSGGSVLKLNDASTPYALNVAGTVGSTGIRAEGTVTSLFKVAAMDMQVAVRGQSLAQLYPLFGIPFPETNPYTTAGRMVYGGELWRYEKFSGRVGKSDIAGSLELDKRRTRPFLRAGIDSKLLDFADLGPLIGAKHATDAPGKPKLSSTRVSATPTPAARAGPHMLPDIPFKTERWGALDADVTLRAHTIARAKQLPIENLTARLKMQNAVLTLDPLDFGFAGGHLKGTVTLDGGQDPIQARARISVRKIELAKLFPTMDLAKASVGQVNGEFDLSGRGNSVGGMLATSNGKAGVMVAHGQISRLLMEQAGLHLIEILQLKFSGDNKITLECGVADFGIKGGVMLSNVLILDTEVSTVVGRGTVDLGRETLDLTLVPKTKNLSLASFRGPIYVKGTFSNPTVDLDTGRIVARGAGALLLGFVNPLLALIPLIEPGPGIEGECARLIRGGQAGVPNASKAAQAPVRTPAKQVPR